MFIYAIHSLMDFRGTIAFGKPEQEPVPYSGVSDAIIIN
jgi:hypothetical protein